jgi:methylmalonyl-CoA mutase cobalamin-binding subunit
MDRGKIVEALTALANELEGRGVSAEMYVVVGAAVALAFDERRPTRDIDAVFEPKAVVYEAATIMASDLGCRAGG